MAVKGSLVEVMDGMVGSGFSVRSEAMVGLWERIECKLEYRSWLLTDFG